LTTEGRGFGDFFGEWYSGGESFSRVEDNSGGVWFSVGKRLLSSGGIFSDGLIII